ncbi:MAG TPA: RNB domain-containing ribonuclease, partial [Candidatus Kapabacteria bacterium]
MTRDSILHILAEHPGELFKTNEISKMLAVKSDSNQYQELRRLLDTMEREGTILRATRRRYGLPKTEHTEIEGKLRLKPTGNGVLTPTKEFDIGDSVLIRTRNLHSALDGDVVRVHLFAAKKGERPQGEITEVLTKAAQRIVGTIERTRQGFFVRPETGTIKRDIFIARKDLHGAREGDRVTIELYDWTDEYLQPEGFVLARMESTAKFGFSNAPIISEFNLPEQFPAAVLKEGEKLPEEISAAEVKKRLDLRGKIIFTIDPEDAKDFDDAVSLETEEDGTVTLGVHIADVAHYVREDSALDQEALRRGTSVYLVGEVIPMLPERISNELCSLRPDEDKLTYSVFLRIDPETAKVKKSEIKKTIIRSVMRFTYREAENRITSGRGKHAKLLRQMRALSEKMYALRKEMGSIDFESEEFKFRFEKDDPSSLGEPVEA